MSAYVGSIDASLSTGNVSYTSVGFEPVALIMWSTPRATEGDSDNTNGAFCRGMTDGTTTASMSIATNNNTSPGAPGAKRRSASIYSLDDISGTLLADATFVSFDSDGFTLNWGTAAASGWDIHFLALGGTEYEGVYVGTSLITATGAHAVTGVGFQPNALITVHTAMQSGGGVAPWVSTATTDCYGGMGFADGSAQATSGFSMRDGFVTARGNFSSTDLMWNKTSTATTVDVDFASMDADGFTLTANTVSQDIEFFYLAIKNTTAVVGHIYTPAAPADVAETGVGALPDAVLFMSDVTAWDGGGNSKVEHVTEFQIMMGAASGANAERSAQFGRRDASTKMYIGFSDNLTNAVQLGTPADTPSVDTLLAHLKSFDADGFTMTYVTTTSRDGLFYLALAGGAAAAFFDNKIIYADGVTVT